MTAHPTAAADIRPERRWPATLAIVMALVSYAILPVDGQAVPPWVISIAGAVALIPQLIVNPHHLNRETSWSRWLSIGFALGLTLVNQIYVVQTVVSLVSGEANGASVLLTALQVWVTNVIAFALLYWELDRGGPVARRTLGLRDDAPMDFMFPQESTGPAAATWKPAFIDYAYFSLSTMMAFSPTDAMPLTARAKLAMGFQAFTGFVLLALVISRGVNILA